MLQELEILFGTNFTLFNQTSSAYSKLAFVAVDGEQLVVKQVKTVSNGCVPSLESASMANLLTEVYLKSLAKAGVLVPTRYETRLIGSEAFHVISNEGPDFGTLLEQHPQLIASKLRLILDGLSGLFSQQVWVAGIDGRLSNFAGQDSAVYFDLFPALCYHEGRLFVHFPNHSTTEELEAEHRRKFTVKGILHRLRFGVLATDPSAASLFECLALEVTPPRQRLDIRSSFEALPDNQIALLKPSRLEDLVDNFKPSDIEAMRSFAARLFTETGEERNRLMREVFVLTSMYPTNGYPSTQEQRLLCFREMLKRRIRGEQ